MNPYEAAAEAVWGDIQDYMVSKHKIAIQTLYTAIIESYLKEKFGDLNDKAHSQMVKYILKTKLID